MSRSALFVTTVPVTLKVFLAPFAEHFRSSGWRVDALARDAAAHPELRTSFDRTFDIAWTRDPRSMLGIRGLSARIRELVLNEHYDIVHVHTPIAAFVTRFALRKLRRQSGGPCVIYTAHGFHFYQGQSTLPHAVYRAMERLAGKWTDYLVTINAEDHEAARGFGTIAPERVRFIPGIGVDTETFSPGAADPAHRAELRRELDIAPDTFMVAMVAEFGEVKRHAFLLDALARVSDERVVVVFIGDGPLETEIRQRVTTMGLHSRVRFAGYRTDIPALVAASDALTLVSQREGLPRSVLEAMASGVPVIGTATRGIVDAVGQDAGWIVAKDDAAALAAALDHAAVNPEEAAFKGAAARERVLHRFSLPRIIDAYQELYDEALASRV